MHILRRSLGLLTAGMLAVVAFSIGARVAEPGAETVVTEEPLPEEPRLASGPPAAAPLVEVPTEPPPPESVSIGAAHSGRLVNGMQMPKDERWRILNPGRAWGTQETVGFIAHAVSSVNEKFPGTKPLIVGDISQRRGGRFHPHKSHQAGRDVDLGFYYTNNAPWYTVATKKNLDVPRTWELVRAMATGAEVERIFVDAKVQRLLKSHALSTGEDAELVNRVFVGRGLPRGALLMHIPRHDTHLHVRFFNPIAQRNATTYKSPTKISKKVSKTRSTKSPG